MALASPPAWPPAIVSLAQTRFIIDVSDPDAAKVLAELFNQHVRVHSFSCMQPDCLESIASDHALSLPTIVIVDDHCRAVEPFAFAIEDSSSSYSSRTAEVTSFHSHADMVPAPSDDRIFHSVTASASAAQCQCCILQCLLSFALKNCVFFSLRASTVMLSFDHFLALLMVDSSTFSSMPRARPSLQLLAKLREPIVDSFRKRVDKVLVSQKKIAPRTCSYSHNWLTVSKWVTVITVSGIVFLAVLVSFSIAVLDISLFVSLFVVFEQPLLIFCFHPIPVLRRHISHLSRPPLKLPPRHPSHHPR
jgi:hypothetical protein